MLKTNPQHFTHVALMGDLVASQAADSASLLHAIFNDAIDAANQDATYRLASPLTITLGDEFQGLCKTLADGVRLMRFLRRELLGRGADCRFVLGVVRIETPVNAERAWNMMGLGLATTRERLEDKGDGAAYRFELPGQPAWQTTMDVLGAELSEVERGWTPRQLEIIRASSSETPAVIAHRLGRSVQSIYKVRRAGRLDAYERMWKALSIAAAHLDGEYQLS